MNLSRVVVCSACFVAYFMLSGSIRVDARMVTFSSKDKLRFIGSHIGLYEDTTNILNINQVSSVKNDKWIRQSEGSRYFNHPYTNNNIWFKIEIDNQTRDTIWLRTESGGAWIIDFYTPLKRSGYDILKLGRARPDENKLFPANHYCVPVVPGKKTYYLMMQSKVPTDTLFVLGTTHELIAYNRKQNDIPFSFFCGLMIAMLVYNLLSLITIGDKVYIYYIGYLIGVLYLVTFAMDNPLFSHIWFWDKFLVWANGVYFMAALFSVKHLNLKSRAPFLRYLVATLLFIAVVPYSLLNYLDIVALGILMPSWQIVIFLLVLSLFLSGIVIWSRGHQNARFYVIAWLPLILNVFIYLADFNGLIKFDHLNGFSLYLGYGFEAVLFSVALGDRVNILKKEKYNLIMQQNEMLEENVRGRTQELQKINATKDRLFAIIGHDLRSPVNSLKGLLDLIDRKLMTKEEFEVLTSKLKDSVNHMYETLNNMLHWANSQMNGFDFSPKKVQVYDLANENVLLTKGQAGDKNIAVTNEIDKEMTVVCDPEHIKLVFRNLISNALKFTPDGGNIRITAQAGRNTAEFCIKDSGVGMPKEQAKKLFSEKRSKSKSGTRGEKGTGLGLMLCKDFIEQNGGKIKAESDIGHGTAIYFTVPIK